MLAHSASLHRAKSPSPAQRRILEALASRPAAKILYGAYGRFITDGRGWSPAIAVSEPQLTALVIAGWVLYTKSPSLARAEYVLTAAGREAVKAK